jgi:predicted Zn-dependent protease
MIRFGVIMVMTMSAGGFAHAEAELHSFGEISDPYFGEALYHYYQRDYFGSLSQTLVALKSQRLEDNKTQARQLLGELYLAYGLHRQAEDVLKSITQNSKTQDIQDHAWLDLATANYQRGLYDDARNNLRHISGKLSGDAEEQYLAIQSSLLLTEQEYRDAANVLQDLRGKTDWGTYGEYNLGIALLNLGRFSKGVDALNRVGRRNYRTHEMKALKDKANLALGFLFLRAKDPAQSIAYLERCGSMTPIPTGRCWASAGPT